MPTLGIWGRVPQLPKVCERDEWSAYYQARRLGSERMARRGERRRAENNAPAEMGGNGRADGEEGWWGDQGQGYGAVWCGGEVDFSTHPCGAAVSRDESA